MSSTTEHQKAGSGAPMETSASHENLVERVKAMQSVWILGVLVVIIAVFGVLAPTTFLTPGNITNIAQNVSIWAVLAVGMTFVIITSGIDLSIGSVLVVSSVVAAQVMERMGDQGWGTALVGLVLSVVVGIFWGCLNGFLVAKANVPPLIVTLGTLSVALGVAQILTGGLDVRSAPAVLQDNIGYGRLAGVPVITIVALVIVVLGGILLHKTRFGRYTYAIGSNETSARRVGINVDRKLVQIYGFTGLLAGIAGILSLAQYGTTTIAGQSLTNLNVIAAVVIGGTSIFGGQGSMFGSMVGLFIPAVLQSGFVIIGVSPYWQTVAVGSILITAVYVDQQRRSTASGGRR
ncbi:ABC transporter permease [Nostocoides sp. Soil756]|jgi:ribose transport system permease protein|uniref:ABC transporter permease n=1 Tax=Nostocoides sp. Soil756 TaxID=1736399 RepID=UPI00070199E9|nr:ABC transporter permease [Tetrasphaera sp. Soil756]KRE62201.1 sugar ABC transporter permease [Tetrasphaera sp. Soil756]